MTEEQLLALKPELDQFLDRYAPLFGRPENQAHARCFVEGLLAGGERRNAENLAQNLAGCNVRNLQAFLTTGSWADAPLLAQMRQQLLEGLAEPDGLVNVDETGFAKKGTKSVGVARQYSGTLGRTDNCQIAVLANYCSSKGHALLERRLYLPQEWTDDPDRCAEVGVPQGVVFRTKPELALEMIANLVSEGHPFRWVGGDSVYGDNPTFVQGVALLGKWYVLDVSCDTLVWAEQPQVIAAAERPRPKRGRAPSTPLVIGERRRIDEVIKALPESAWKRVAVGEGSQGPRLYDYAEVWVWFSQDGLPGAKERLLARRSLGQEPELKYHRSNAPVEVPMRRVAEVRGGRWSIEEDIQLCKGECGLDEYETRGWLGWHHHTALAVLALAFLVLQKLRLGGKRKGRADDGAGGSRPAGPSARGARVGHRRDPSLVSLAS
jgi:SRSO17 transposase